ncbi:hypothetical protein AAMO2058_000502100 [Amorphochlora amoebiformis]
MVWVVPGLFLALHLSQSQIWNSSRARKRASEAIGRRPPGRGRGSGRFPPSSRKSNVFSAARRALQHSKAYKKCVFRFEEVEDKLTEKMARRIILGGKGGGGSEVGAKLIRKFEEGEGDFGKGPSIIQATSKDSNDIILGVSLTDYKILIPALSIWASLAGKPHGYAVRLRDPLHTIDPNRNPSLNLGVCFPPPPVKPDVYVAVLPRVPKESAEKILKKLLSLARKNRSPWAVYVPIHVVESSWFSQVVAKQLPKGASGPLLLPPRSPREDPRSRYDELSPLSHWEAWEPGIWVSFFPGHTKKIYRKLMLAKQRGSTQDAGGLPARGGVGVADWLQKSARAAGMIRRRELQRAYELLLPPVVRQSGDSDSKSTSTVRKVDPSLVAGLMAGFLIDGDVQKAMGVIARADDLGLGLHPAVAQAKAWVYAKQGEWRRALDVVQAMRPKMDPKRKANAPVIVAMIRKHVRVLEDNKESNAPDSSNTSPPEPLAVTVKQVYPTELVSEEVSRECVEACAGFHEPMVAESIAIRMEELGIEMPRRTQAAVVSAWASAAKISGLDSAGARTAWWFSRFLKLSSTSASVSSLSSASVGDSRWLFGMFHEVMSAWGAVGRGREAVMWFSKIERVTGMKLGSESIGVLANAQAMSDDARGARKTLSLISERTLRPDISCFTPLIVYPDKATSLRSQAQEARYWFEAMKIANVHPPRKVYAALIGLHARAGQMEQAEEILSRLSQGSRVTTLAQLADLQFQMGHNESVAYSFLLAIKELKPMSEFHALSRLFCDLLLSQSHPSTLENTLRTVFASGQNQSTVSSALRSRSHSSSSWVGVAKAVLGRERFARIARELNLSLRHAIH